MNSSFLYMLHYTKNMSVFTITHCIYLGLYCLIKKAVSVRKHLDKK